MTSDTWSTAQRLLQGWPGDVSAEPVGGTCRRLRDALTGLSAGSAGPIDVATLVRQVLLEHAARTGVPAALVVPYDVRLSSAEVWCSVGCTVLAQDGGLRVFADAWHPPVGPEEDLDVVSADLEQVYRGSGAEAARPTPAPADPFWESTVGFTEYRSVGQRQAARTLALAPPGSLTIVALSTGMGKTAVVQASALLRGKAGGVCVTVVPTVVLALDMERRTREFLLARWPNRTLPRRLAYLGGMSPEEKKQVRDDIANGSQPFVFTSPEALLSGLSGVMLAASRAGHLRFLVVDEAHLVEQWGNEFRPEFQTLAGLRTTLVANAPPGLQPVTVAMSATLTGRDINSLARLFGSTEGETAVVWASALRVEPSFYRAEFDTSEARRDAILEAVAKLPKPMVLYASTREAVREWAGALRQTGIHRFATVTGDSTDDERRRAVEGWRGSATSGAGTETTHDVVVATSAFGLGVDMGDVRTVLHACVPETLDRFYQEVGRGGRDGRPCLSYVASTPSDWSTARSLNETMVISADRGWQRWQRMQQQANAGPAGTLEVDLEARPVDMQEGFGRNRQWNVRTLNLMAASGLIRLATLQPPERRDDEAANSWRERVDAFYASVATRTGVQRLDGKVNDQRTWTRAVEEQRTRILADQKRTLTMMAEALSGHTCVGSVVAAHYWASWDGGKLTTARICRGCPNCRKSAAGQVDGFYALGMAPFPALHPWSGTHDVFAKLTGQHGWVSIWWETDAHRRDLVPQLLERLARRGLSALHCPDLGVDDARALQVACGTAPVVLDQDSDLLDTYAGPLVVVLPRDAVAVTSEVRARLSAGVRTVVVHPANVESPERRGVRLKDWCNQSMSIQVALGSL